MIVQKIYYNTCTYTLSYYNSYLQTQTTARYDAFFAASGLPAPSSLPTRMDVATDKPKGG